MKNYFKLKNLLIFAVIAVMVLVTPAFATQIQTPNNVQKRVTNDENNFQNIVDATKTGKNINKTAIKSVLKTVKKTIYNTKSKLKQNTQNIHSKTNQNSKIRSCR